MLSCYCIAMLLMAMLWAYMAWLNRSRRKAREEEEAKDEHNDLIEEWHDLTDKEVRSRMLVFLSFEGLLAEASLDRTLASCFPLEVSCLKAIYFPCM